MDSNYEGSEHDGSLAEFNDGDIIREQDRLLPIANVARIMKQAVPANAKIAKDAKECAQECVSEFISFVTSEAAERCQQEKRKTINGEDIIWAMETLGFDQYAPLMKIYLQRFKEITKTDKGVLGQAHIVYDPAAFGSVPMGFNPL